MRIPLLSALAISVLSIGCGSNGAVHVTLHDTPAVGNVTSVLITVDEVRIHDDGEATSTGGGAAATADGATGKGWIVVCSDVQTVDLLQLTGGKSTPLCGDRKVEVATGYVSQMRLGVKSAQIVVNGATQDLDVPSGASSGLKIDVHRDVQKDQTLELSLDFDAKASLVQDGNGAWHLKPVLRLSP